MSSAHVSATLDYLTDAAHLLRATAAETSAHLMKQRGDLMFHHGMSPSPAQRQHVCGACGHIMVPGDGAALRLERRKLPGKQKAKQRKQAEARGEATGPTKMTTCGKCSRVTRTPLAAPGPPARRRAARKPDRSHGKTQPAGAPGTATASASSKKRAKNRKAGLQALLAGQQQRQTASPLSLGDFMKK